MNHDGRKFLSSQHKWAFRLIAGGVPVAAGAVGLIVIFVVQERLVIDRQTGWPKWQTPPLYLEEPGYRETGHRYLYDPLLGWRNIPHWSATSLGRDLNINSKGLRDREHEYQTAPGVSRILVLGDSYAWGYGVNDRDIFGRVLESRLGETQAKSKHKWEVINTGVSGWGTDQEYLFLTSEGFKYSPSVVVLALFLVNDPLDNTSSYRYTLHKPMFVDTQLTLSNQPTPKPGEDSPRLTFEGDPIELTIAIIDKMADECTQRNCDLVVMKFGRFIPGGKPALPGWEQKLEQQLESTERSNLHYLDLDEQFRQRNHTFTQLVQGNDDGHWNRFGHKVTAEILHEFLINKKLLE